MLIKLKDIWINPSKIIMCIEEEGELAIYFDGIDRVIILIDEQDKDSFLETLELMSKPFFVDKKYYS